MKKHSKTIIPGLLLALAASCLPKHNENISAVDSLVIEKSPDTTLVITEFGERFSITGDFNGDKIIDTVSESYISSLTNKETYKTLNNQDWQANIDLVINNKPISRIYTNILNVDTFIVTKNFQQAGLFHYRNLGDINDDGKDEIGYAVNWVDNSNLNTYHIIELKDNKFEELFNFSINESFLEDEQEGLFENHEIISQKTNKIILYKFYTDSATNETGEHEFE